MKTMPDSDTDFSDIPEADEEFWASAVVRRRQKEQISIRLDADVLTWLRKKPRYQSLINDVLRTYVDHEKRRERVPETSPGHAE